jgi:hypothetical protein
VLFQYCALYVEPHKTRGARQQTQFFFYTLLIFLDSEFPREAECFLNEFAAFVEALLQ